ncbi:NADH:ubiquinone oxidoreductase subunit ASHI [Augochlora pura]
MAALTKYGELSAKLLRTNIPRIQVRNYKHLDPDEVLARYARMSWPTEMKIWVPGPTPKTEWARRRAAAKYNMHPNEYIPSGKLGDYPKLPTIGVEAKDPYYPWDFPSLRRNYGEVIHPGFDMMGEDRFAYGVRVPYNYYKCSAIFVVLYIFMIFIVPNITPKTKPVFVDKQLPFDGKVHYSFEPAR